MLYSYLLSNFGTWRPTSLRKISRDVYDITMAYIFMHKKLASFYSSKVVATRLFLWGKKRQLPEVRSQRKDSCSAIGGFG